MGHPAWVTAMRHAVNSKNNILRNLKHTYINIITSIFVFSIFNIAYYKALTNNYYYTVIWRHLKHSRVKFFNTRITFRRIVLEFTPRLLSQENCCNWQCRKTERSTADLLSVIIVRIHLQETSSNLNANSADLFRSLLLNSIDRRRNSLCYIRPQSSDE